MKTLRLNGVDAEVPAIPSMETVTCPVVALAYDKGVIGTFLIER